MIRLSKICKTYKVSKREAGFKSAAKALFSRKYTEVKALDKVSFEIQKGEMVGYIGPNGAGKSSTVKVMSGILTPDSGICEINGLCPWKDRKEHVKNIGVVFGQRSQLWWDVPVIDSFELIKDIYSVSDYDYRRNLEELTELLNIGEILKTPARQLSLGQRMRCEISASLLHNPQLLFLDEPTIGLDAISKLAVRDFIKSINKNRGTTVILTTHDMQDIEALTDRILLIGKGQILLDGNLQNMKNKYGKLRRIKAEFKTSSFNLPQAIKIKDKTEGSAEFEVDTELIEIGEAVRLISASADIRDISVESVSAEDMVVSLYKEFKI